MGIPNTMRAMVLEELGKPLQIREVAVPKPQAGQVLTSGHSQYPPAGVKPAGGGASPARN